MSSSSNDPNKPDPNPELDSTGQPLSGKPTTPSRPGQAALLAAALAAAGAAQAGAAVPAAEPNRAYLEALLHGSWTQPPDLNARRLPPGTEAETAHLSDEFNAGAFNDSFNPHPTPYTDKLYIDTGFNDSR